MQALIQDFTQERGTAKTGPKILGGPETRGSKIPPIKNQKVCKFGVLLLVGAHSHYYFLIFTI